MQKIIKYLILSLLIFLYLAMAQPGWSESFSEYVNESGTISLPQDYRGKWVHLGSWAITDEDAPAFHDVYAEPEAVERMAS